MTSRNSPFPLATAGLLLILSTGWGEESPPERKPEARAQAGDPRVAPAPHAHGLAIVQPRKEKLELTPGSPRAFTSVDLARLKRLQSEVEFEIVRWLKLPPGLTEKQAPPGTIVIRPIRCEEYFYEVHNPPFVRLQLSAPAVMEIQVGSGGRLEVSVPDPKEEIQRAVESKM